MISKPLIAVVEDEDHLAQGLLYNLKAEGYRTHHEADGDGALAWLLKNEEPPAAVILDVMLPGRDGFSIVRALREAGQYTPVLLLTARGRSEDVVEGFAAGADDYLAKPFDLGVLFARLASLLRRMAWQNNGGDHERRAGRSRALHHRRPHHRLWKRWSCTRP
jgi:DNA-binding response OmpR family regulator